MDKVEIAPYDPEWPRKFEIEAARLSEVLNPGLLLRIEHFGSTAVPGLSAKPIIDIMVLVSSISHARSQAVPALEKLGYAFWSDNPAVDRLFFVKGLPPNGPRTHHVHIVSSESRDERMSGSSFAARLQFRDYLRKHQDEVRRYETLKRVLAVQYHEDREAYTAAKTDYVLSVMQKISAETKG